MSFAVLQSVYKKDVPEYLRESLLSIEEQTLKPDLVVIVMDGKLPEELLTVIEDFKNKLPLKVVGYDENKGLAHALNFGLKFIDTDYVARMDSDDICFPERFEKQIKFMGCRKDIDISGTSIKEFYCSENNSIRDCKVRNYPIIVNRRSKCLFKGTPIAHPTAMIKTNILKRYKYAEDTSLNEDIDLWFRLIDAGITINNIQEPLLNFRITDNTFKRRSFIKAKNEYKIYRYWLRKLFGFSFLSIYPVLRFITRFFPYSINKSLYLSNIRKNFFAKITK